MQTIYHYLGMIVFWVMLICVVSIFITAGVWFVVDRWLKFTKQIVTFRKIARKVRDNE